MNINIESFDLELCHLKESCKKEINKKLKGTRLSLERSEVRITLIVTTKTLSDRVEKIKKEYFKEKGLKTWRVLKNNGTLIFKWNEFDIKKSYVLEVIGRQPLFGHCTNRSTENTHWFTFMKIPSN